MLTFIVTNKKKKKKKQHAKSDAGNVESDNGDAKLDDGDAELDEGDAKVDKQEVGRDGDVSSKAKAQPQKLTAKQKEGEDKFKEKIENVVLS